jgi:hypothetical protein
MFAVTGGFALKRGDRHHAATGREGLRDRIEEPRPPRLRDRDAVDHERDLRRLRDFRLERGGDRRDGAGLRRRGDLVEPKLLVVDHDAGEALVAKLGDVGQKFRGLL